MAIWVFRSLGALCWLFVLLGLIGKVLTRTSESLAFLLALFAILGTISYVGAVVIGRIDRLIYAGRFTEKEIKDGKAKQCYQCAEYVPIGAQRCKHCGDQFHRIEKPQAQ